MSTTLQIDSIVVVTQRYMDNTAESGMIGKLIRVDCSDPKYFVDLEPEINSWCRDIRLATHKEMAAYNSGIRNIKDIDKKEWYEKLKKDDYVVCLTNPQGNLKRIANGVHHVREDYGFADGYAPQNEILYTGIGKTKATSRMFEQWRLATSEEAAICKANDNRPISIIKTDQPIVSTREEEYKKWLKEKGYEIYNHGSNVSNYGCSAICELKQAKLCGTWSNTCTVMSRTQSIRKIKVEAKTETKMCSSSEYMEEKGYEIYELKDGEKGNGCKLCAISDICHAMFSNCNVDCNTHSIRKKEVIEKIKIDNLENEQILKYSSENKIDSSYIFVEEKPKFIKHEDGRIDYFEEGDLYNEHKAELDTLKNLDLNIKGVTKINY